MDDELQDVIDDLVAVAPWAALFLLAFVIAALAIPN